MGVKENLIDAYHSIKDSLSRKSTATTSSEVLYSEEICVPVEDQLVPQPSPQLSDDTPAPGSWEWAEWCAERTSTGKTADEIYETPVARHYRYADGTERDPMEEIREIAKDPSNPMYSEAIRLIVDNAKYDNRRISLDRRFNRHSHHEED